MKEVILGERNKVMAKRAIKLLRTYPGSSLFFAFGADHFEGDDSVTFALSFDPHTSIYAFLCA